jgi:hypothetical protein
VAVWTEHGYSLCRATVVINTGDSSDNALSDEEIIARAGRAMARASEKAMADYKRFGIDPVISNPPKQSEGAKE